MKIPPPHPETPDEHEQRLRADQSESVPRSPHGGSGNGEHDPELYVDVAALLDGGLPDPPAPVLLHRTDGNAILYGGQVNYLFGDPESGKTLVAQAAGAEALIAGRRLAFVDIDHNGPESIVCRFMDMGVPEEVLRDPHRFRYVEPEDKAHLMRVVADLKGWRPAVVVVDSVGELLPLMGLSSNSPDDFTLAHASVLKSLAMAGAAVIAIDHLAKGAESRTQGSTGTAAKRRAVGGVSIRVVVEDQFTPGQGGSAFLTINKDRHGGLRRNCPTAPGREAVAGVFRIAAHPDRILWSVEGPKAGDVPKADRVDPGDLEALTDLDPPPSSVRDAKERLRWRSDRATRALREWRSQRSPSVPGERGTLGDDSVPRSRTPYVGNGEHDPEGRARDGAEDIGGASDATTDVRTRGGATGATGADLGKRERSTGATDTVAGGVPRSPHGGSGNGERAEDGSPASYAEPTCIACSKPVPVGGDGCMDCFVAGRIDDHGRVVDSA